MDRYKVIFKRSEDGADKKSWGYYEDYEDFRSRNSTYIFVRMTKDREKIKETVEDE